MSPGQVWWLVRAKTADRRKQTSDYAELKEVLDNARKREKEAAA